MSSAPAPPQALRVIEVRVETPGATPDVICVAHRPSTLARSTVICVIDRAVTHIREPPGRRLFYRSQAW